MHLHVAFSVYLENPGVVYTGISTFMPWYEVETYTRDTPCPKKLIDDAITFVTQPMYISQTGIYFC